MFATVQALATELERILGYGPTVQTFEQVLASEDGLAIASYPLLGEFANGSKALFIRWSQAPTVGASGIHCYIEPLPQPGSDETYHNWRFELYSLGTGETAGLKLQEAFKRLHEQFPIAETIDNPDAEPGLLGITYLLPQHLSAGACDYAT